jgi:CheY-like chemotaxis protein
MIPEICPAAGTLDPRFKIFHELMAYKIRDVLLISTTYDAWIMQEDGRLSERIANEYRGLNLSNPPRLNWASTVDGALAALDDKHYDLVIVMARAADRDAYTIAEKVKKKNPALLVALLTHRAPLEKETHPSWKIPEVVDETFVWSGNTDILLAMIKCAEDAMNIRRDTKIAGIRVIILVEDSPVYMSSLLPILYKQLVVQAQTVMEEGLNQEHRLLAMRARPKVLIADSYERGLRLFNKYEPFVLGIISDARIPRSGTLDGDAGIALLRKIKKKRFDIPRLLYSAESQNAQRAEEISAGFVDKNSPRLLEDVQSFLLDKLGFGDFVFRNPDGSDIARASNLWGLEKNLHRISGAIFEHHSRQNDFSRWLFARSEIELATTVRDISCEDFSCIETHQQQIIEMIHARRMQRQKGVVVNFDPISFDTDTEFLKIGTGSLGGKARGLAFMSAFLHHQNSVSTRFKGVNIYIPQTLVITTDIFEAFVETNYLTPLAQTDHSDEYIAKRFLAAPLPEEITDMLRAYLSKTHHPLAVRSSSLLEDARFRAYAGLYNTFMLPNDHEDLECRLDQLIDAIRLVYASTYYQGPKAFSKRVGQRTEEEKMAVIIQGLSGGHYGKYFYPAISGVAQSHNYYPFGSMQPEEGIATIALGLGKTVMAGEKALRFSPAHPQALPQSSSVADTLKNAQRYFYALEMEHPECRPNLRDSDNLVKREIADAENEPVVSTLLSTYLPDEDRIRDVATKRGYGVLTFSKILKYNLFPLSDILKELLSIGQEAMGCPVEVEFSVDLDAPGLKNSSFSILQIRPMNSLEDVMTVDIPDQEINRAVCVSTRALGNTVNNDMKDILYVKPDTFDPAKTMEIAAQIAQFNALLLKEGRKYLLIGPGRWGSADRWLGIPVSWADICGVGAMVETAHLKLKAEPSQGSHFFHNITSLGVNYLMVFQEGNESVDWQWLTSLSTASETSLVAHVRLDKALTLKVDGRRSLGIVLPQGLGIN